MSTWRTLRLGLRSLFHKNAVERDIDDELRHFLTLATQENLRKGMPLAAAERAARIEMGGLEASRTDARTSGWEGVVERWMQDVRIATRGLRRSPGFTLTALASLALGIGVITTMFSIVNAVMLRPLPYRHADRLALIWTDDVRRGISREVTAHRTIADWQAQSRTLPDIAYFSSERIAISGNEPSRERGRTRRAFVSTNLFPLLGVVPQKGRLISLYDEREGARVAVISHSFWMRWFDGAPDVIGKTVAVDEKRGWASLTVIGVMSPEFYFPDKLTEIWTPATTYWRFTRESTERFESWARRWTAIGRLAPGASIADARTELASIGRQLARIYPATITDFPGFATTVLPVLDSIAGTSLRSRLWILLGAVGVVLLVVCANIANLQLARGATRQREFAVRRALGAGRGRLVSQIMAESLVLVVIGGAIGTAISAWGTPLLANAISAYVPRMDEVALDGRVLFFATAITIVSGVVFGLAPMMRLSATDANDTLKEGGRGTATLGLRRSQRVIVLAQCAMALMLLTGAGLLLKSLNRLQSVRPGFDPRNVLMVRVEFPSTPPPNAANGTTSLPVGSDGARARALVGAEVTDRVRAIPGVESVGFVDDMFIAGQGNESITIPGRSMADVPAGELNEGAVSPDFFSVMRVPLRRGRYPTRDDAERKAQALFAIPDAGLSLAEKERLAVPEPVVVNEAFVRRYFPGEDPIGKRFCTDPANKTYWYEIVGVVGDMRRQGLERITIPEYYGPYLPSGNGRADLVVRITRDPLSLAAAVRAELTRAVPGITIVTVSTAESQFGGFTSQRRLQTWLLTMFAALALAIAAIGIFGLAHYAVAERTREIGVRVALGATPGNVLRLVIAQGMQMPALGILIGLAASAGLTRIIAHQLYDVQPTDPLTFGIVALLLALVSAAACYLAARRAVKADPAQVLRQA